MCNHLPNSEILKGKATSMRSLSTILTLRMEQDSFQNPTTQTSSQLRSFSFIFMVSRRRNSTRYKSNTSQGLQCSNPSRPECISFKSISIYNQIHLTTLFEQKYWVNVLGPQGQNSLHFRRALKQS